MMRQRWMCILLRRMRSRLRESAIGGMAFIPPHSKTQANSKSKAPVPQRRDGRYKFKSKLRAIGTACCVLCAKDRWGWILGDWKWFLGCDQGWVGKQHPDRFADGQLGGKIAHTFEQCGRDFLAARDQQQAFARFQIFTESHADGYVFHHAFQHQRFFLRNSAHSCEGFESLRVVPAFATEH